MYGVGENNNESRDVWQKHLDDAIIKAKCDFIYDLED